MDTLTLKASMNKRQMVLTSVSNIRVRSLILLFILLAICTLPSQAQKGSTSLTIKYGLFNSKIRYASGGIFRANTRSVIPSALALQIKHQFSPSFRFGAETGFVNEQWDVDWIPNPVDIIEMEIQGRYQRNTLYAMINAEYCIPGAEGIYVVGGIGPAHHFNREVTNARIFISYPGATEILNNAAFSIKDEFRVVWKFGAGFNVPIAKTLKIGLDMSYYVFNKTKGTAEYLQNFSASVPGIGFSGFVGALNIVLVIPGT